MALDTHTKRLLWSGLRAGVSSAAACVAGSWGIVLVVGDSTRGWGSILALLAFFAGPVVFPFACIRGQERLWPFAVRYPENAVPGALWGWYTALMLLNSVSYDWAVAAAAAALLSSVAALIPYRIFWPALIVSPLPPFILYCITSP